MVQTVTGLHESWQPMESHATNQAKGFDTLRDFVLLCLKYNPGSLQHPATRSKVQNCDNEFEREFGIGEKIGQGHFGQVFQCSCHGESALSERTLCVKVTSPDGNGHEASAVDPCATRPGGILQQLLNLEHPNLVRCHRVMQTGSALYTIMDRCCGPDLDDYLASNGGQLLMETVGPLLQQMISGVAALHDVGIMHRDVKPENLRFTDATADRLQLLDFGLSKQCHRGSNKHGDEMAAPSQHTIVGTLLYVAPEVFDGFYGRRCDLWSVGVVAYELCAGQQPFNTSDVHILRSLHRDPVLTGSSLFRGAAWDAASLTAQSLVRGLLSVDQYDRLSAAAALEHSWFAGDSDDVAAEEAAKLIRNVSGLGRRPASSAELKRTAFAWNLADYSESDSEDEP